MLTSHKNDAVFQATRRRSILSLPPVFLCRRHSSVGVKGRELERLRVHHKCMRCRLPAPARRCDSALIMASGPGRSSTEGRKGPLSREGDSNVFRASRLLVNGHRYILEKEVREGSLELQEVAKQSAKVV